MGNTGAVRALYFFFHMMCLPHKWVFTYRTDSLRQTQERLTFLPCLQKCSNTEATNYCVSWHLWYNDCLLAIIRLAQTSDGSLDGLSAMLLFKNFCMIFWGLQSLLLHDYYQQEDGKRV